MKSLLAVLALLLLLVPMRAQETKLEPRDYLDLHNAVINPAGPDWKAAMEKLVLKGDSFTINYLKQIKTADLDPKSAALVASFFDAAGKRLTAETDADFVKSIELWLRSAALADVTCDPLEAVLPAWALKKVRENIERPGVREEIMRIKDTPARAGKQDAFAALAEPRVKAYAERVLAARSSEAVGGATIPGFR